MNDVYLIIVILLFVLAISDLIVGVSNDAVNFLNSAIGSKVAPRHIIMIVASLGIIVGSTFSSGMMEVARKGIFNPEYFFLSEIMIIFLAVMITDIILLDLFNTFGMPTSTTVSIVFELLGAAVAVSFLKINAAGESLGNLSDYINSSSALLIISGIFISVLIAFVVGAIVQYLSRLLFSFQLDKRMHWVGAIWSGIALSALSYFLLIKGAKGSSLVSADLLIWVQENTIRLLLISLVFWSILMQLCLVFFKWNILRFVVLFGTFALAMAFAGNDLVNFIGVPIAGLESFNAWRASEMGATEYTMGILNEPVRTQTYLLVTAGIIMVTTLWFSKKARSVTETEVNLGRQDEGNERFRPNALAQGIVRYSILLGQGAGKLIPLQIKNRIEENFKSEKSKNAESVADKPAFDLIRASVNLTMASVLIAFATSLKLPLSTTYVSFMVAMGTSLADRAWGRSSAVYRIAGVINVIGGWFFTAFMAFVAAASFAALIFFFKIWAIIGLMILAVFLISRTFLLHRKNEKEKAKLIDFEKQNQQIHFQHIIDETGEKVNVSLDRIRKIYREVLSGLIEEERTTLKQVKKDLKALKNDNKLFQQKLFGLIKRVDEDSKDASKIYLLIYDLEQDIIQSISTIVNICNDYVRNSMDPIKNGHELMLINLWEEVDVYLKSLGEIIKEEKFDQLESINREKKMIFLRLESSMSTLVEAIKIDNIGMRNSLLLFNIVLETKDLIAVAARFAKLYKRVKKMRSNLSSSLVSED